MTEPIASQTMAPTAAPTTEPTAAHTEAPTAAPTTAPTEAPTAEPNEAPTTAPTAAPTTVPTAAPTTEILFPSAPEDAFDQEDQLDKVDTNVGEDERSGVSCAHGLFLFPVMWSFAVSGVALYL